MSEIPATPVAATAKRDALGQLCFALHIVVMVFIVFGWALEATPLATIMAYTVTQVVAYSVMLAITWLTVAKGTHWEQPQSARIAAIPDSLGGAA